MKKNELSDQGGIMAEPEPARQHVTIFEQGFPKQYRRGIRMMDLLRKRELVGRASGIYNISTVVGAEHIKDISAKSDRDFNPCYLNGIVVFPDNRLVGIDGTNFAIKVIDVNEDTIIAEKRLPYSPYAITMINFNKVAILMFMNAGTCIAYVKMYPKIDIVKTMEFPNTVYNNITYCNDQLFVTCLLKETVSVLDMDGHALRTLDFSFMALHRITCEQYNNDVFIYATTYEGIYRMTLNGDIVGKYLYNDMRIEERVMEIDVDRNGNIYFTKTNDKCIYKIHEGCDSPKEVFSVEVRQLHAFRPPLISYSFLENRFYICFDMYNIKVYTGVLGIKYT